MEPDSTLSCSKELATEPYAQMNHTLRYIITDVTPGSLFLFC